MADMTQAKTPTLTRENARQKPRKPIPWSKIAGYVTLIIGGLLALLPFIWMFNWSLMTNSEVIAGRFLPAEARWDNYLNAWNTAQFSRFMWNSIRITGITVIGLLLFCIPAAYAFARIKFWGRNVIFALFLATLMIPDIVTLIPNLLTIVWISRFSESIFGEGGAWLNNWQSLTIPFMASAFTIFLLRQFFIQLPNDLWDAARIDGATHITFLRFVAVPLARAPIMTTLTFAFITSWNSLLWPLLVVSNDNWRPVAFGLTKFVQTDAGDEFHLQMAASVIMIIPILIVYFITQRQFTEGIWSGSVKG